MRATVMYGAGDVRVDVPDATITEPTDAPVRVVRSCICGSDLWPYGSMAPSEHGRRMGHEFLGVIEDTGAAVSGFATGDLVIAPFLWSDGTCDFCRQGLQTSCRHGGQWGHDLDGGQSEAVRVPQAQGTLVKVDATDDPALLASLLSLSDVFCTGHHAAVTAGVNPRTTVTVVGDGAVGLSAAGHRDLAGRGPRRRHHRPRRRLPVHRGPDGLRHPDAQHHPHRRSRPRPRLHRGAASRCPGREDPAGQGLRPYVHSGRRAGRLPRDGRREALKVLIVP